MIVGWVCFKNCAHFHHFSLTRLLLTLRYGHNTGHATDTALQSVANIGMTAYNIDNLGLKAFLSSVSEKSANTVLNVKDIQPVETEEKGMLKAELRGQKEMERREQCAKGKDMEKQTSQTEPDPKNLQSKNKEEKK